VEAVFRPEVFRIFSDDFRPVPARKQGSWQESTGKNPDNFPCFHAGSCDFPASFLQDLVAGIIDLGIYYIFLLLKTKFIITLDS
jgi:hypothetical protein